MVSERDKRLASVCLCLLTWDVKGFDKARISDDGLAETRHLVIQNMWVHWAYAPVKGESKLTHSKNDGMPSLASEV